MIEVKHAVEAAMRFVRDIYPGDQIQDVALEEVRKSDDEREWLITVGFRALSGYMEVNNRSGSPFLPGSAAVERVPRDYKELVVDDASGEVREMKIREL